VSYWKGLTAKIDASGNLTGTFSNFPANFVKDDSIGQAGFSGQLDALLHLRAFKEKARVNPFLTVGAGIGYFPDKVALYAPLGTGLQFRFNEGTYLFLQAQWRKKLSNGINNDYLHYSLSFAQHNPFGKKKKEAVITEPDPVLPPDADGDGFADANDRCPTEKGNLNGCPDSDNDGVADKDDQCPTEKGTLNGCPDSDNDGVADKDDKCKDAAGLARYGGCPIPDTDNDGVNDEADKCPNEAGTAGNKGCPEIKEEIKQKIGFAAKNIFFQFASDIILKKSFVSLNEVAKVLAENPSLKLTIAAHADNRGTPERNMMWSERRAKAVADYFISKGIAAERIAYKGFGDTQPAGDNKTAAGRALNRRVEMNVDY
jgi:outer membrane protein OmpA-like peptidoglycan-associated protein